MSSYVKANHETCDDMIHCINKLFETPKRAVIVPGSLAKHFESTTNFSIFCFSKSETYNLVTRSFSIPHFNNYLLRKMNPFIQQAFETGHLQKWEDISSKDKTYKYTWDGPIPLTIEHTGGVRFSCGLLE